MKAPVIYKIRNVVDGKFYVGSTMDTRERFRTHRKKLRANTHHCHHLQHAWNKYGEDVFKFEIVEEVANMANLQAAEDVWLAEHVGQKYCYNIGMRSGAPWRGVEGAAHPLFGRSRPEEHGALMSKIVKERYVEGFAPRAGTAHTPESRAKISAKVQQALAEGRGGKFIPSEETRKKMSESLKGNQCAKGHIRSAEHRRKLSEANKGNSNFKGKKHTDETRLRMSKPVIEVTSGTEFTSLTDTLVHYDLKMPTLRRALLTGLPLSKGPRKGLIFRYKE